jgi:AAA+ superfamily predicted ATPase
MNVPDYLKKYSYNNSESIKYYFRYNYYKKFNRQDNTFSENVSQSILPILQLTYADDSNSSESSDEEEAPSNPPTMNRSNNNPPVISLLSMIIPELNKKITEKAEQVIINNKRKRPIEWTEEEEQYEFGIIDEKLETIDDLIDLGKKYHTKYSSLKKRYNLNLRVLADLVDPLTELSNMIGMKNIKKSIFDKIILYLQGLDNKNHDFLHTVIYGGPGMGKTEVAKIIGKIYTKLGLLSKGDFKEIRLTDLKAGYVGQSELKTQKVFDDAKGCVLFMDEAYSLGSDEKLDQYSQSIIDVINPYLDKYKDDFIFIVAGYKNDLQHRFFKGNQGLRSRFGLWLEIDEYKGNELLKIFEKKVKDYGWSIKDNEIKVKFFDDHIKDFKFFGRDIENLFSKCKIAHAKRVLYCKPEDKKIITNDDIEEGYKIYKKEFDLEKKDDDFDRIKSLLYL